MSLKEIDRTQIIEQVKQKQLKQADAAKVLGVSVRQVKRLVRSYRQYGAAGLISKRRGTKGHRQHDACLKSRVKELIHERYSDFGPTFAAEKLLESHQLKINKETLRQWLMEWGLWKAKRAKKIVIHQSRTRRSCFGELIQIDGSHHDWFEGRAPRCCLLVFIDDATSRIVGLRFEEQETTAGYFRLTRQTIETYGRPLAFYSDKDSIFRNSEYPDQEIETQFARAMRELDIELICANSPQAKGRVERANGTLQDRLVKELRLRNINDIETANTFLPTFALDYNQRFAIEATDCNDVHRQPLPDSKILNLIFSIQSQRTLSKNLELSYEKVIYQVQSQGRGYRLRHAKINVCEDLVGTVTLLYKGHVLLYQCYQKQKRSPEIITAKQLEQRVVPRSCVPKANHPWRQYVLRPQTIRSSSHSQGPQAG